MAEEGERGSSVDEEFNMSDAHVAIIDAIKRGEASAIEHLIAADVRLQPNLEGTGPGGNGKEVVMAKLEDIAAKAKNSVAAVDPIRIMRCGNQTRSIFTIKKSVVTVRVGTAITWVGGRAVLIVMDKGTNDSFYVDNTQAPVSELEAKDADEVKEQDEGEEDEPEVQARRRSVFSVADVLSQQFQPPYLVPRPEVFPPPSLRVHVVGCKRLKSAAALPRPMNSYVRVRLGKVVQQTDIVRGDKNPKYSTSRFMFEVPVDEADNARLIVEVWDSNIGVDDLLSMFEIPLSAIPAANPDTMNELHWTCRLKLRKHRLASRRVHKFDLLPANEVTESTEPVIMLGLQKQDMKMWWSIQESRARDAQAERELETKRNAKAGEKVAHEDLFDPEEYDSHQEQCSIM